MHEQYVQNTKQVRASVDTHQFAKNSFRTPVIAQGIPNDFELNIRVRDRRKTQTGQHSRKLHLLLPYNCSICIE